MSVGTSQAAVPLATGRRIDPTRLRRWVAVGAVAVALAPALVAIARLIGRTMVLEPDIADIDLLTRDVWSIHVPLIGVPGRFGFNHPGPLLFFGLAPVNLLAGDAWGTQVGGALLQAVAVVWAARLAFRRGGLTLELLVLAAIVGTYLGSSRELLLNAWNPNPIVPFAIVLILQLWSVTVGDRWRLVGAVVVASLLVQTHVLWGPPVAAAVACLLVVCLRDWWRDKATRAEWTAPVVAAGAAGILVWLPALVDEAFGQGNLGRTIRFTFGDSPAPGVGLQTGLEVVAAEFRLIPAWLGGSDLVDPATLEARTVSIAWLLIPVLLVVAGFVVARRSRDPRAMRLLAFVAVVGLAAVYGSSVVARPLFTYLLTPRVIFATMLAAAVVWIATLAVHGDRAPRVRQLVIGAVAVLLLAGSATQSTRVATHRLSEAQASATVLSFTDQLAALDVREPVILRDSSFRPTGLFDGLVDELDRAGVPVRVEDFREPRYGPHRATSLDDVDELWIVTNVGATLSDVSGLPDARVLVLDTPLDRADEAEIRRIQRRVLVALKVADRLDLADALGGTDRLDEVRRIAGVVAGDLERLEVLNAEVAASGRPRSAVIALPSDSPAAERAGQPEVVLVI